MLYIIHTDIESVIKKIFICKNNTEISSTSKTGKDVPCKYAKLTTWVFDHVKNMHSLHRVRDSIKKFCESLRGHSKNN